MDSYPGKILLIDDDQDTRDIYQEFLTGLGYKVDLAVDGEEGLAMILQGGYDLILLDIMMPKIDGIGVLKRLKEKKELPVYNGPIVVLSALDQEYVVKEAMSLGAKGFVSKVLSPEQVLNKVVEFLKKPQESQHQPV